MSICRIWLKFAIYVLCCIWAEMSRFSHFVYFGRNIAIYALCRILAEMSRFTRFPRHKMYAARHLKLFCTPVGVLFVELRSLFLTFPFDYTFVMKHHQNQQ